MSEAHQMRMALRALVFWSVLSPDHRDTTLSERHGGQVRPLLAAEQARRNELRD